jgi:hypothetical protein
MQRNVHVWAVELGPGTASTEREGRLWHDADRLRFEPAIEGGSSLEIPFLAMTKVRRLRGSPVLMETYCVSVFAAIGRSNRN